MRILLDTHAFIWWLAGNTRLPVRARRVIDKDETDVYVSAASAWEIATKARLGKLPGTEWFASNVEEHVIRQGFVALDITIDHAERAGALPGPHKDPFDRILIAQAQAENLTLVSNETVFDRYGVVRLW